jgi:hypothetical protein
MGVDRRQWRKRRHARALGFALVTAWAVLVFGCSRREEQRPVPAPVVDTLANGLPRSLAPQLAAWVEVWRHAVPGFAPESLARGASSPFAFDYGWPVHGGEPSGRVRERALIDVLSPDSAHSLDFDMYLDFDRDENGKTRILREPDSAPVLADFGSDTLWRVAFCGTPCFYDGACWVDAARFALTGATRSGPQADGPWQPFLEVYDLNGRQRTTWAARPVSDRQFRRYQSASDSALIERLEHAGFDMREGGGAESRVQLAQPVGQ